MEQHFSLHLKGTISEARGADVHKSSNSFYKQKHWEATDKQSNAHAANDSSTDFITIHTFTTSET